MGIKKCVYLTDNKGPDKLTRKLFLEVLDLVEEVHEQIDSVKKRKP